MFSISNWIIYPCLTGKVDGYGRTMTKMGKRKTWVLKTLYSDADQKTLGNTERAANG